MFEVRFDARVFSLEVVKGAAYAFTRDGSFDFSLAGDSIVCTFTPASPISAEKSAQLQARFKTAVLDQDLRRRIGAETAPIRNAILAYAFSKTHLSDGD